MSEKVMRSRVVRGLKSLHAVPVENPACPGTPDVNCVAGWIELKWMRRWPENADTSPLLIPHYTAKQRLWAARRHAAGQSPFLLLQVAADWLLFEGEGVQRVGSLTRPELFALASKTWKNPMDMKELSRWLVKISAR